MAPCVRRARRRCDFVFVRERPRGREKSKCLFAANDNANFTRGHRSERAQTEDIPQEEEEEEEEEARKTTFVPRCSPRHVRRVGLRLRIPFNYAQ